ncbi:MAG: hypothetical protein IPJ66_06185 [Bacteroidetes bacterium]|nr:hypothetical protein [Bacteroidota bacterium]MBL0139234.1 hypothetical protein [Bacteroidota bacterium]
MSHQLPQINVKIKSGQEQLNTNGSPTGIKLIDFWKWSVSDLISNATRGRFAEFIVASALGINMENVRDEWSAYDLISPEGIKIEVKSAAYIQSWAQEYLSKISFSIKAARYWDRSTNIQDPTPSRPSDFYVFCLLKHQDQPTLDPMNLDQWEFYVVSTLEISNYKRSQSSITLNSLQKITQSVKYSELQQAIIDRSQRQ